ncbi:MAG: HAD hydrolase-like protein [Thermodesulfovibrionales bacterium]
MRGEQLYMICDIKKLKKLSFNRKIKVVSFDIFDTLLIRKIDPPEEIKKVISSLISEILPISPNEYILMRTVAEQQLRNHARSTGFDPECSIEEIIEYILKKNRLDSCLKDRLISVELQVEKSHIAPMPGIKSILTKLKNRYKLIAASDTYLSCWMINVLLQEVGLADLLDAIYCSCDYKLNKGSGRLFKKIAESERINISELLHIGDNFMSDYFVPRRIGCNAILLYEKWNIERRGSLRLLMKMEKKSVFWKGYSFVHPLLSIERPDFNDKSESYLWGKIVVGPLLTNFLHILTSKIKDQEFERIFFIARDGFILKKLYILFSKELYGGRLPQPEYMFISRYTSFIASIKQLGEREIAYATWGSNMKVIDALRRLGVQDIEPIKSILEKHDVDAEYVPQHKELCELLYILLSEYDLVEHIKNFSQYMRELLREYLKQIKFFGYNKKIALVDIGWTGTIQDCLEYTFQEISEMPLVIGYYLGLNPPMWVWGSTEQKQGLIYDYRQFYPEEMSIPLFREALEFSCRAFHGTTVGYKKLSYNRIVPILKGNSEDRIKEKMINKEIAAVQKGILDFANEYLKMVKIKRVDPYELKPYVTKMYETCISFPSKTYINAVSRIINTDDFGTSVTRSIVRTFQLKEMLSPDKFIMSLIDTPWREASLLNSGMAFINYIYNLAKRWEYWKRRSTYNE